MTPTTLDFLGNYTDAVDAFNYVIDAGDDSAEQNLRPVVWVPGPNETLPIADKFEGTRPRLFVSQPSNVLSYDMNRTIGNVYDPRPRGSWKLKAIYGGNADAKQTVRINDNTVSVRISAIRCVRADHAFSVYLWLW